jgi:hypothetical protein
MPSKKNQDNVEQAGNLKDGLQTKDRKGEKSHSEPHVGKSEKKQVQKPVKYDLYERPWPVC